MPASNLWEMASKFIIYGLIDPRTGHLRYVGKSDETKAKMSETHKARWAIMKAGKADV